MPIFDTIGGRIASTALAVLGAGAGIASFADHTAAPTAPAVSVAAPTASALDYSHDVVIVPEGENPDTTPVTKVTDTHGAEIWIPEEDPNGGHPTQARMWLDNSPLYSGGWLLQITDGGDVTWIDVQERLSLAPAEESEPAPAQVRTVAAASPPRPAAGSCSEPAKVPPAGDAPSSTPSPAPTTAPLVNVNTASVAELDALPGIGDVLAARIVAQRPYASVADLHRVARIPAKVFPLVTV